MTSDPGTLEPDTKDWTWVLERACHECGFDMASTHKSCPACGATMARQARFCTDCGHAF